MKLVKAIAFFMLGIVLFTSCKDKEGAIEQTTFQIEGMTCEIGCAKLIESRIAGLDGVNAVKVDFETKTANIEFDDSKQSTESLVETVEKIANGLYKVESISSVK